MVLCFSPVGTTLRVRSRKFPAVTNCTAIDWFHEWPAEALVSVSRRFLEDIEQVKVSLLVFDQSVLFRWRNKRPRNKLHPSYSRRFSLVRAKGRIQSSWTGSSHTNTQQFADLTQLWLYHQVLILVFDFIFFISHHKF